MEVNMLKDQKDAKIYAQTIEDSLGVGIYLYASIFYTFQFFDPPIYDNAPFLVMWCILGANDPPFL
jgi:hypothetical protein